MTTEASQLEAWRQQVWQAETAFAQAMARRDSARFAESIDDEAIFFTGPEPLRGKAAVLTVWWRFFEPREAPFSWEPDRVEVLASGHLALSTGPVRAPDGRVIGRFNSIWRQVSPDLWRVVFDKGSPVESTN